MQRPIEAIYQSLLPGISTITLRFRYYAFFPWILKNYEDHIRHTDPAVFRVFHRRCEILFALVCSHGDQQLGIAGYDWAHKKLGDSSGQSVSNAVIDFGVGADPETEPSQRYLRNMGGAFGGIYASEMAEMGLVTMGDHLNPIPICTERALPLAAAFRASLGSMAEVFFDVVKAGSVSISVLGPAQGDEASGYASWRRRAAPAVGHLVGQSRDTQRGRSDAPSHNADVASVDGVCAKSSSRRGCQMALVW